MNEAQLVEQQTFAGMPVAQSAIRVTVDLPLMDENGEALNVHHGDMVRGTFEAVVHDVSAPEGVDKEGNSKGSVTVQWKAKGIESLSGIDAVTTRATRRAEWEARMREHH